MPEKQKVYCGMKQVLPDGYDRFAIPYQCLKKGFGACLYAGKRGTGGARRYEEFFFNKLSNRILFILFLVLVFLMIMFVLYKFFTWNKQKTFL